MEVVKGGGEGEEGGRKIPDYMVIFLYTDLNIVEMNEYIYD